MRERAIWSLFIVALVVTILSGCTAPATSPAGTPGGVAAVATPLPEPVTINYWEWRGGALAAFMVKEAELFHEQYPWITIQVSQFPNRNAYRDALGLAFESGDVPDVFIRPRNLSQMVADNWVQPIDAWITPEWKDKFPAGSFAETMNVWQGQTYSFPVFASGSPRMLFINEDLFRQAELVDGSGNVPTPKTWGELRSMAAQVTQAGKGQFYGIGIGIKDPNAMSWWFDLASLGGAPMTPYDWDFRTGEFVYGTHPAFAQIVELLLGMKADGSVYPYESILDDSNIYSYFGQGKFAIMMSGSYVVSNLEKDFPDLQNYQVVPLPVPDQGQTGNFILQPGIAVYYLSSRTAHPYEAWLWMDWLSARETHKRMVAQASNFSIYGDLNTAENISDKHELQAYVAQSSFGVLGPFPPIRNPDTALVAPKAVTPDVGDVLIGIYTGQITDWRQALVDLDGRKAEALAAAIKAAQEQGADVSLSDLIFSDWNPLEDYVTRPKE